MFGAGALGGFFAGLLGIGGGPIYVVIFTTFVHQFYGASLTEAELVKVIIANTLFAKLFAGLSGVIKQIRLKNFYPKTVLTIAIPAICLTIGTSILLRNVNYSETTFSILFILILIPLIYNMLVENKEKKRFNQPFNIKVIFLNLVGVISGVITALTGLGGGFTIIPLLNSLFNIKIRKVISISLGVIFINSSCISLYYLFFAGKIGYPYTFGMISFSLCLPVIIGVILLAPIGVIMSRKLSPFQLRLTFVVFCLLIIAKTIYGII